MARDHSEGTGHKALVRIGLNVLRLGLARGRMGARPGAQERGTGYLTCLGATAETLGATLICALPNPNLLLGTPWHVASAPAFTRLVAVSESRIVILVVTQDDSARLVSKLARLRAVWKTGPRVRRRRAAEGFAGG